MSAEPSKRISVAIDVTKGSIGAITRPCTTYGALYERTGLPFRTTVNAAAGGKITAEPR